MRRYLGPLRAWPSLSWGAQMSPGGQRCPFLPAPAALSDHGSPSLSSLFALSPRRKSMLIPCPWAHPSPGSRWGSRSLVFSVGAVQVSEADTAFNSLHTLFLPPSWLSTQGPCEVQAWLTMTMRAQHVRGAVYLPSSSSLLFYEQGLGKKITSGLCVA